MDTIPREVEVGLPPLTEVIVATPPVAQATAALANITSTQPIGVTDTAVQAVHQPEAR